MEYKRHQHSVYLLTYHAVFVTKYRRKVITTEILKFMRENTRRLLEKNGGSLLEFNGEEDHIHVLFELPPISTPSKVIGALKTQLSRNVRTEYGDQLRDKLWKDSFWSDSYFLTTTGGASIDVIEEYIQQQGTPRKKRKYTQH